MSEKPTYEELEQRVKKLEKVSDEYMRFQALDQGKEAILNSILEHVVHQDTEMKILWANRAACESVNLTDEEIVGRYCYEVWPQRSDPCPDCPVKQAMETCQPQEIEKTTPDGRCWFIRGYPLRDSNGNIKGGIEVTLEVTEHKRAKDALKKSEEKYREFVEGTDDFIAQVDHEGRLTYLNDKAEKVFGLSKKKSIGLYAFDFVHPDDRERTKVAFGEWIRNRISNTTFENRQVNQTTGEVYHMLWTINFHYDEEGNITNINSIARDITEHKNMGEALRESEERFRYLTESSPLGVFQTDKDGSVLYLNDKWLSITGLSLKDALGFGWVQALHPEDRPQILAEWAKCLEEKRGYDGEFRFVRPFGDIRWVHTRTSPVFSPAGDIISHVGVNENITERKQAEEALKESEEKYRQLFEMESDAIFLVRKSDGQILEVNTTGLKLYGFKREELLKMKNTDLSAEPDITQKATMKQKRKIPIRYHRKNDGTIFPVEITASHLTWQGQEVHIAAIRDITIRIEAEKEKVKYEEQLRQSNKMEAIDTLAGGIAHDFNNLLMGIQGRTSLMQTDTESYHPHFEHLRGIENYVKNAADLTTQLLAFARGGKYEVKPIDLNELINRSAEMFGRTKKEMTIHRKNQENIWAVEVDQGQIEQVLLNLYVNAWQSMPGGGDLYLETENVILDADYVKPYHIEPGKYVKMSVTDTGVGMDKATQAKIFDPFFTTKEMGRGTGLGLASAYGIIKNHNGIIYVYSKKGEGTTFNIYLPASEKEIIREPELDKDITKGDETILLVDDEDMIIDVAKALLQKMGYKVLIAKSGKAAVELYEANKDEIDMVILDMIMPNMGGGDTYDKLKEINPDIKALLSSGYSIDGQASEILERGCDGFIQKPFSIKALSQKIRDILVKD